MHKRPWAKFARSNFIACKFTLVCTLEECYPSFGNTSYKAQKDRGQTKNHRDSMVEVIATSNRCELDSLENLFSRESLKLGRIETKGPIRYSYYLYHEDIPMVRRALTPVNEN